MKWIIKLIKKTDMEEWGRQKAVLVKIINEEDFFPFFFNFDFRVPKCDLTSFTKQRVAWGLRSKSENKKKKKNCEILRTKI